MKHTGFVLSLLSVMMLSSCGGQAVHITVTNDLAFAREEVVELSYAFVCTSLGVESGAPLVVRNQWWRRQPWQVTSDSSDLLIKVKVGRKGLTNYWIKAGRGRRFDMLAEDGGTEPPAWRNDRAVFCATRQGLDLEEAGHMVAGAVAAPYAYGRLWTAGEPVSAECLEAGPLRVVYKLTYAPCLVADSLSVSQTCLVTLDAGAWFTRVEQTFEGDGVKDLTWGIGLYKRMNNNQFVQDKTDAFMTYWNPDEVDGATTALAVVMPPQDRIVKHYHKVNGVTQLDISKRKLVPELELTISDGCLLMLTPGMSEPLVWYFGGAADGAGFETADAWRRCVKQFAAAMRSPLHVGWK